jgi:hypothetical protein
MKNKMLTLSLLTLGICTVALATEYKSPEVGFQTHPIPSKEMKTADFGDQYKVESGAGTTDRQIASEEDDREPSSVTAKEKKVEPEMMKDEPAETPKPWLYRMEENHKH